MQTDELLKILDGTKTKKALEQLIEESPEIGLPLLSGFLTKKLAEKEIKKSEAIKRAQIDRTYGYQIFQGKRMPGRDHLLCLCVALSLNLYETQQALAIAQHGRLYPKNKRDALLIYGINQKHTVMELNDLLYEAGEELLGN